MAGEPLPWWGPQRTQQEERPTKLQEIAPIELGHLLNRAYHIGRDALRALFEEAEASLWENLRRQELSDGRPRFVGHGTRPRILVPRMGRVDLRVRRIHDRLEGGTFVPLL